MARRGISVFFIILMAIIIGALLMSTVNYGAKATDSARVANTSAVNLEKVKKENGWLKSEAETKISEVNIDQYATEVLGMSKTNVNQITYVEIDYTGDVKKNIDNETLVQQLKIVLDTLSEYFFG
jgi:cell division protein FtsL